MRDPFLRQFVAEHQGIKSKLDAPWRWWAQEVEYERASTAAFREAALAAGLDFAGHQVNGSLIDDGPLPCRLGCPPAWVDLSAAWGKAIARMRELQRERGTPILTNTWDLSGYIMDGVEWADHPFNRTKLGTLIPYDHNDPNDVARFQDLPAELSARELVKLQNASITDWSDSAWCDRALSPIWDEAEHFLVGTEQGDPCILFDVGQPRDSWASCRHGHGWNGRPRDEVHGATEWFTGKEV
jgi:hypothetical protein